MLAGDNSEKARPIIDPLVAWLKKKMLNEKTDSKKRKFTCLRGKNNRIVN